MVVGDRLSSTYFAENKRPFHNAGNSLVRKSINVLFKSDVRDIMTGYRAFSRQFVKSFPVLSKGFEIETEMTVHAVDRNMRIENVVIEYRDRPAGSESKLSTFSDGMRVLRTIARLFRNYRPLAFFGGISLMLALLAAGFFVPVLMEYLRTGLVPNLPTLVVCGFAAVAAIQSFFSGLILETLRQKDRQDFEMELVRIQARYINLTSERQHHAKPYREHRAKPKSLPMNPSSPLNACPCVRGVSVSFIFCDFGRRLETTLSIQPSYPSKNVTNTATLSRNGCYNVV